MNSLVSADAETDFLGLFKRPGGIFLMNCPKCQGSAYLADEDLVKVTESAAPVFVIIKQTYVCRSCGDRFSRIVTEEAEGRKKDKPAEAKPATPDVQRISLSDGMTFRQPFQDDEDGEPEDEKVQILD
jgi:hypothetical protein